MMESEFIPANPDPEPNPGVGQNPEQIKHTKPIEENPPRSKRLRILLMAFSSFLGFVLMGMLLAGVTVYSETNIPLLSNYRTELSAIFSSVPFLPKTKQSVLLSTINEISKLETFTISGNLSSQTSSSIGSATYYVKTEGPVDLRDIKNARARQTVQFGVTILGKLLALDLDTYITNERAVLKVTDTTSNLLPLATFLLTNTEINPDETNLAGAYSNWVKIPTNLLGTILTPFQVMRSFSPQKNQHPDVLVSLLKDSDFMSKIQKASGEKIDGQATNQLTIKPDQDFVNTLFSTLSSIDPNMTEERRQSFLSAINSFEYLEIHILTGKRDGALRKITAQGKLITSSNTASRQTTDENQLINPLKDASSIVALQVEFKDINKDTLVQAPEKTISLDEFTLLLQSTNKAENDSAGYTDEKRESVDSDLKTIRSAITKYVIANGKYPETLGELVGEFIPSGSAVASRLEEYTYRRGKDNVYVVFTAFKNPDPYGFELDSPYYGYSSKDGIIQQLSVYDISPY